ncbi:MAG: MFS transporter [Alphaproteobacteria bacterium]|nr:MFS transporter [Alphaproteobacteria bacterium]
MPTLLQKPFWKPFWGYGIGDYGLNLFWQSVGFYLFFYYTNVLGVSSSLVGTIILIGSLWDAVTDPAMGYLAERTKSRWGPYRPYLLFGAAPLGLTFGLLFTPVSLGSDSLEFIYLLAVLLAFRTCYTVVSIPYASLGARITRDSNARTRLAGIRMYCGFLGGVSISFLAKKLQSYFPDDVAFPIMAFSAAFVGFLVLIGCFKATANTDHTLDAAVSPAPFMASLQAVLKNGPFLLLVGGIIFVTIANTIIGQSLLFFFESHLGNRHVGTTAIVIMTAAPLVSIPLWAMITLRIGKRNAWIAGSLIGVVGLAPFNLGMANTELLALVATTIITLGLSSYAVIFWSMLPDTIEYGEYKSMVQNESLLIGLASSFQKVTIGLSAFALGILLELVGYTPGIAASNETAQGIKNIFSLIPMIALLLSSSLILFYPITAKLHGEILEALRKRA